MTDVATLPESFSKRSSKLYHLMVARMARAASSKEHSAAGIIRADPDYEIRDVLNRQSVVVDCGTGNDADFSQFIIRRYGAQAIGFEPTRKHHLGLDALSASSFSQGGFRYYKLAVGTTRGRRRFFESRENVSGSFYVDHANVMHDHISSYEVEVITIDDILELAGVDVVDALKMDIEGEEYELFSNLRDETLRRVQQWVVEFHHHCISRFSWRDTRNTIRRLAAAGFRASTLDGINYLFYRFPA